MNALNAAWQTASQQMYAQGQQAQPGADAGQQQYQGGQQAQSGAADDVQDADFEEVK
jgi:molecular chaperone DnaK